MLHFTLADGRRIQLGDLHILPSALRMTVAGDRGDHREQLASLVQQFWPGADITFTVVWPPYQDWQTALCLASFTSRPLALDECEGYSFLVVCWFVWHTERNVAEIVEQALVGLSWEDDACDMSGW